MIWEYRFYDVAQGRLAAEVVRMYDVAIRQRDDLGNRSLFDVHGIPRPRGAWTVLTGPRLPQFGYLLFWPSMAERERAFGAFREDELWQRIRRETDGGHPMVERTEDWLLARSAAWSPDLGKPGAEVGELHELRRIKIANGRVPEAIDRLKTLDFPILREHGAHVLGAFDVVIGPDMATILVFIAWANFEAQSSAWRKMEQDERLRKQRALESETFGLPFFPRTSQLLLSPTSFGMPHANFGETS